MDKKVEGHIFGRIAVCHRMQGNHLEAINHLQKSLQLSDYLLKDDRVFALRHLAGTYIALTEVEKGIEILHSALEILAEPDDNGHIAQIQSLLGGAYIKTANYPLAIEYFTEALVNFRSTGDRANELRTLGNLANSCCSNGDKDAALIYCQEMLERVDFFLPFDCANAYSTACMVFFELGDLKKARSYNVRLITLARKYQFAHLLATGLEGRMRIFLARGKLDEAITHGLEAIEYATRKDRQCDIHRVLSEVFQQQGKWEEAHHHLQRFNALWIELVNSDRDKVIAEMQARFDLKQLEHEKDRLRSELSKKESELSTLALHLVDRQEIIELTIGRLKNLKVPGSIRVELRAMINDLTEKLDETSAWALLERQFNSIHANFVPALLHHCPNLTPAEMQVCILTRLNLDTKHIASILCILPRTVQNHRLSIRRKLNLRGNVNLVVFLVNIAPV